MLSIKSWCWRTIRRDNAVTRVNNVIVANTTTGNVKHLFSRSREKWVSFVCTSKKILVYSELYWSSHTPCCLAELAPSYWGALRCPSSGWWRASGRFWRSPLTPPRQCVSLWYCPAFSQVQQLTYAMLPRTPGRWGWSRSPPGCKHPTTWVYNITYVFYSDGAAEGGQGGGIAS